jgi:hypothetical protein
MNLAWNRLTPKGKLKFIAYPFAIAGPKAIPFLGGLARQIPAVDQWLLESERGDNGPVAQSFVNLNILRALNLSVPSMANPATIQGSSVFPAPLIDEFNKADGALAKIAVGASRLFGPFWGSVANAVLPNAEKLYNAKGWHPAEAAGLAATDLARISPLVRNLHTHYTKYVKGGGDKDMQDWLLAGLGLKDKDKETMERAERVQYIIKEDEDVRRAATFALLSKTDPGYARLREDMGWSEKELGDALAAKGVPLSGFQTTHVSRHNYKDAVSWWNTMADAAEANPNSPDSKIFLDTATPMLASRLRRARAELLGPDGEPTNRRVYEDMDRLLRQVTSRGQELGATTSTKKDKQDIEKNDARFDNIRSVLRRPDAGKFTDEAELFTWAMGTVDAKSQRLLRGISEYGGVIQFRDSLGTAREAGQVSGSQMKKKWNPRTERLE